jgi:predicted CXXCH cytochrome family protein
MFSLHKRFFIAILVAILAAGITLVVVQAQEGNTPQPQTNQDPQCVVCHTEFQMTLDNSKHGQAGTDPVFVQDWTNQGKPGACLVCHTTGYDPATATWESDGITCTACHTDANNEHPKTPMTVDQSPDLCGRCHSDTRFGWQDWEGSTHYQRGMSCTTCHDPHSASLKNMTGPREDGKQDISALCINCHQEASMNFPYTAHHQKGVACVDCHLEHLEEGEQRAAHTVPDHSFGASLDTCNTCHADEMHAPVEATNQAAAIGTLAAPGAGPTPGVQSASITPEPTPVSPLGYAILAALIGLAGGMVLAPWLERFYRRVTRRVEDDRHGKE